MTTRYLLHFAHEHISFRWTEFLSLAAKNDCHFKLISSREHLRTRPFILIELEEKTEEQNLIGAVRESHLLKDLYELWSYSSKSIDDLSQETARCPQFLSRIYCHPDQTFRINCESYGNKLSQETKVDYIKRMLFMESFESRPNLKDPKQTYCIIEMNEGKKFAGEKLVKEYYFCRHLAKSDRSSLKEFSLKTRKFIGNTSLDPQLSFIAANSARVKHKDLVYDPFVGSGSLLVAAAYKGAYVLGADIDWQLLHGKSRPSRKGQRERDGDECIRANLKQYNMENNYIDVLVSDITRPPFGDNFLLDAIISDPPYGVRESSERIGSRKERMEQPFKSGKPKYPSKTSYSIRSIFSDLLELAARHLKLGGRLVYFLPVLKLDRLFEEFIPSHPCLDLVSFCDQALTSKNYRLMIVMEKSREYEEGTRAKVPDLISDMNYRDALLVKSDAQ